MPANSNSVMQVSVDYAACREIVYIACRRAACFMGYALNAARNDSLKDFTLSKEYSLHLFPENLPDETITEYKKAFEGWAVTNGLRELIEGFSTFLDNIWELTFLASRNGKQLGADFPTRLAAVRNKGLPGKQKALREDFSISSDLSAFLKSIYEARNCLSHARGIVTPEFFNAGNCLKVSWSVLEIFVRTQYGTETVLTLRKDADPVGPFDQPAELRKRLITRTRSFSAGETLRFSFSDLAEICIFVYLAVDSFFMPAVEFAKQHGLK
jgi:hypothetical protein